VVKNPPSDAGDVGSIPGRGTKIPHAVRQVSLSTAATEPMQTGFLGATIGAGLGNAFSDFLGGLGATNLNLAFGSGLGCLIALGIIPIYLKITKKEIAE